MTLTPQHSNNPIALSICIATYNRGDFIRETMDCIVSQLEPGVEIVVVDGASADNTSGIMASYVSDHAQISYYREDTNSGVDADFDKSVGYAKGQFCWLMTDDDLLHPGSVRRVMAEINDEIDLIVVDAEVRNADFSVVLEESRINLSSNRVYQGQEQDQFFSDMALHLSFIGCVIIRRDVWMERNRTNYYGTVFIHIGVIFQNPQLKKVCVIANPMVIIRYGNAMWTPRAFDIWMFKWPKLLWGFSGFSDETKNLVSRREPWRNIKSVFEYRAKGAYTIVEYKKYFADGSSSVIKSMLYLVAIFPESLANALSAIYVLKNKSKRLTIYDLSLSNNASMLTHYLNRKFGN